MAQTKPKAGQFYGVSGNGTDGQFLQTDGAGGMTWADTTIDPTLSSIDYPGSATAADPAGGESIIINGTGFQTGITCTIGGTSATTAFNSATQITITSPAKTAGQYTVAVANTDGGSTSQTNFIQYSGVPVWTTNSGSLGSVAEGGTTSFQVTATEGSDTIEYAVTSGSLPSGYSLATATGAITGTAPSVSADTTSTFSITATDDENQTSSARSFSITVTNIAASSLFNTVLYTDNSTSPRSITSVGFLPDFTWVKSRSYGYPNILGDSVRGLGNDKMLISDFTGGQGSTAAEANCQVYGYISSLDATGFTATSGTTNGSYVGANGAGDYVAWNWKAGGAPTATNSAGQTPTAGSKMVDGVADSSAFATVGNGYPSKQSINTNLDFSITEYTKTASGASQIPHGLSGAPDLVILKFINPGYNDVWQVWASGMNTGSYLELNSTNTANTRADSFSAVNSTYIENDWTGTSLAQIVYSFKSKAGYSKIGSFTGDGTSSKLIETGFQVGWVMFKNIDTAYRWYIVDDKRGGSSRLFANDASAQNTNQQTVKFLANGFEITTSDAEVNKSGDTIIYIAFAADGSTTTPSLASSFSAVENTSPTTNQAIAAGFTPDMAWIIGSNIGSGNATAWGQYDTVRGSGWSLQSDNDGAQYDYSGHPSGDLGMAFTSTGYNTPPVVNNNVNNSSDDYINYFWKAGGLGSINTDGTISSIVSANQAAGFSIVKWVGDGSSSSTVGHSLGVIPDMIISKCMTSTNDWWVAHVGIPNSWLNLDDTNAAFSGGGTNGGFGYQSAFTSSVFGFTAGSSSVNNVNQSGQSYIAYCFKSIAGFSKMGTYTASGSAGSPTITTGFQPGFVMIKNVDRSQEWIIIDSVRGLNKSLQPDSTAAEGVNGNIITTNATSFTIDVNGGGINYASGDTMIYAAFKIN